MTEAHSTTAKSKTAKPTDSSFGLPNYESPKIDLGNTEVPAAIRELAEKGVAQARDTAEEATGLLKNTYTNAAKGATDYNLKVLEIARTNTNTAFDYVHNLMGAKSLTEYVRVSSAHARQQVEAMAAQTKELAELAQKVTTEVVEPLKTGITKAFNNKIARP
jgi:phasin